LHMPFLLRAAKEGRATFVERLMRHYGCDVNSVDLEGNTALHVVAYYGHADVVDTLLDSGLISDVTMR
jgi:ankyrin repeat protein